MVILFSFLLNRQWLSIQKSITQTLSKKLAKCSRRIRRKNCQIITSKRSITLLPRRQGTQTSAGSFLAHEHQRCVQVTGKLPESCGTCLSKASESSVLFACSNVQQSNRGSTAGALATCRAGMHLCFKSNQISEEKLDNQPTVTSCKNRATADEPAHRCGRKQTKAKACWPFRVCDRAMQGQSQSCSVCQRPDGNNTTVTFVTPCRQNLSTYYVYHIILSISKLALAFNSPKREGQSPFQRWRNYLGKVESWRGTKTEA